MTVSTTLVQERFAADGTQVEFSFPFRALSPEHLEVRLKNVSSADLSFQGDTVAPDATTAPLKLDKDFTVSLQDTGGAVDFGISEAPEDGFIIIVSRNTPRLQNTDYTPGDPFPALSHERALDKLTLLTQERYFGNFNSLRFNVGDDPSTQIGDLPPAEERPDRIITFDDNGRPILADRLLTVNPIDNDDGTVTLEFSDGSSLTTDLLRGPEGPEGPQGPTGDDLTLDNITENGDGTFTWNFSDGTSFTTSDLTGPEGPEGPQGPQGDDLTLNNVIDNGDGTFTWEFSDGTNFTTSDLTGPEGPQGPQGPAGDDLTLNNVIDNGDGTFTWEFSDGTSFTTSDLTGPAGSSTLTNPMQFGAVGDGSTDDGPAFQNMIDDTTDGDHVVFDMPEPPSSYHIDTPLNIGNRSVLWRFTRGVSITGTNSVLPGNIMNTSFLGDERMAFLGEWMFGNNNTSSGDRQNVRIDRRTSHASSGGATGITLFVNTIRNSGNGDNEDSLVVLNRNLDASNGRCNAFQAEARKEVGNGSNTRTFGGNFVAKDLSTQSSATSGGSLVGLEVTLNATLSDDADTRLGIDTVMRTLEGTAKASYLTGQRIRPSEQNDAPVLKNGLIIQDGNSGGTVERGIFLNADFTDSALTILDKTKPGILRLGTEDSQQKVGRLDFRGPNNGGSQSSFGVIRGISVSNTQGSEDGRIDFLTPDRGTLRAALQIDEDGSDPVRVMLSNSLERITKSPQSDINGNNFVVVK